MNETVNNTFEEEPCEECDIIIEDGALDGFEGHTLNITENVGSKSDLEVGIEFIYNMREHTVDIFVATLYALLVYAIILWLNKKFKN
jgi:hypothetical protein